MTDSRVKKNGSNISNSSFSIKVGVSVPGCNGKFSFWSSLIFSFLVVTGPDGISVVLSSCSVVKSEVQWVNLILFNFVAWYLFTSTSPGPGYLLLFMVSLITHLMLGLVNLFFRFLIWILFIGNLYSRSDSGKSSNPSFQSVIIY